MNIDNDTRVKFFFLRSTISTKNATAIHHVLLVNNADQYREENEKKRTKFSVQFNNCGNSLERRKKINVILMRKKNESFWLLIKLHSLNS